MAPPLSAAQDCPFCAISAAFPPSPTHAPSSSTSPPSPPSPSSPSSPYLDPPLAYTILSTPYLLAFLDHAPIARGHLLVTTRRHREKLSDVPMSEASALGSWLPLLSRVVAQSVDPGGEVADWNVVQNNGPRAAQVVPHVHFHIIPRTGAVPSLEAKSWTVFGRGVRMDLDEEDALGLVGEMRRRVGEEIGWVKEVEGEDAVRLLIGEGSGVERREKL
ncbi:hypothetical protein MMC10_007060 [Thelotrema lepadinum]|nr:hypothetical protein [Thelotrema lepadinum]